MDSHATHSMVVSGFISFPFFFFLIAELLYSTLLNEKHFTTNAQVFTRRRLWLKIISFHIILLRVCKRLVLRVVTYCSDPSCWKYHYYCVLLVVLSRIVKRRRRASPNRQLKVKRNINRWWTYKFVFSKIYHRRVGLCVQCTWSQSYSARSVRFV